jgi:hypothetical protein
MSIKIEHRVGIPATADAIWDVLADLSTWPSWNPLYPRAEGVVRIGEQLRLTERIEGLKERVLTPRVLDWVPREQILWAEKRGFMSSSIRYFEIHQLEDEVPGCIFSNGIMFDGYFGEGYAEKHRRKLRRAFETLGEALKARVQGA